MEQLQKGKEINSRKKMKRKTKSKKLANVTRTKTYFDYYKNIKFWLWRFENKVRKKYDPTIPCQKAMDYLLKAIYFDSWITFEKCSKLIKFKYL